jgi:hypothetical protein
MIDNNFFIFIAIVIVIFLIYHLNKPKDSVIPNNKLFLNSNNETFDQSNNIDNNSPVNFVSNISTDVKKLAPASLDNINDNIIQEPNIMNDSVYLNSVNLDKQYSQDIYNSNINPNMSNMHYAADFGSGYNLGVDTLDPNLKKYMAQAPPEKTQIISDDLLPQQNEDWFETPLIGTKVDDANLLADAIFKVGVDTVGQTRKNPAYDIRGTIANPKFAISPWNNSSWEPDNNLKSLC